MQLRHVPSSPPGPWPRLSPPSSSPTPTHSTPAVMCAAVWRRSACSSATSPATSTATSWASTWTRPPTSWWVGACRGGALPRWFALVGGQGGGWMMWVASAVALARATSELFLGCGVIWRRAVQIVQRAQRPRWWWWWWRACTHVLQHVALLWAGGLGGLPTGGFSGAMLLLWEGG